jgi:hypothetical protein
MGSRDDKRHPDSDPRPHEIDDSARAADADQIDDVFVEPEDGLDRVDELGIETPAAEDVEKSTPEVADELDHAGLEDSMPADHPGEGVEEQTKGVQARWGKAGP